MSRWGFEFFAPIIEEARQFKIGGAKRREARSGKELERRKCDIENIHGRRKEERVKGERKEGAAGHEDRLKVRRGRVAELLSNTNPEGFGLRLFLACLLEFGFEGVKRPQRLLLLFD